MKFFRKSLTIALATIMLGTTATSVINAASYVLVQEKAEQEIENLSIFEGFTTNVEILNIKNETIGSLKTKVKDGKLNLSFLNDYEVKTVRVKKLDDKTIAVQITVNVEDEEATTVIKKKIEAFNAEMIVEEAYKSYLYSFNNKAQDDEEKEETIDIEDEFIESIKDDEDNKKIHDEIKDFEDLGKQFDFTKTEEKPVEPTEDDKKEDETPVDENKPGEDKPIDEDKPVDENKPGEETPENPVEDDKKDEEKPIDEDKPIDNNKDDDKPVEDKKPDEDNTVVDEKPETPVEKTRVEKFNEGKVLNYEEFRTEFMTLLNAERESKGLKPLELSEHLKKGTEIRSTELGEISDIRTGENREKTHKRPETGDSFRTAFDYLEDYDEKQGNSLGENLLAFGVLPENINSEIDGVDTDEFLGDAKKMAKKTFEQWKNSEEHYQNMINPDYTTTWLDVKMGKAAYTLTEDAKCEVVIGVQVFDTKTAEEHKKAEETPVEPTEDDKKENETPVDENKPVENENKDAEEVPVDGDTTVDENTEPVNGETEPAL